MARPDVEAYSESTRQLVEYIQHLEATIEYMSEVLKDLREEADHYFNLYDMVKGETND